MQRRQGKQDDFPTSKPVEFSLIFPDGQDIAFIDEVYGRGNSDALDKAFTNMSIFENFCSMWSFDVLNKANTWLWIASFVYAILLVFLPPLFKRWWKFIVAICVFLLLQYFNLATWLYLTGRPEYDDGAGDMFAPVLLMLPMLLVVLL